MTTSAPYARRSEIFSWLILSGITKMQRYPLIAAAIASPTPVLPEVGSTIVPPGFSFPSRSAASIIASPIRSLTEPPGFRYSSLARISPGTSREMRSRRTIGVFPTRSRTMGYSRVTRGKRNGLLEGGHEGRDERSQRRCEGRDLDHEDLKDASVEAANVAT